MTRLGFVEPWGLWRSGISASGLLGPDYAVGLLRLGSMQSGL
ncbi:hypothetical protein NPIL_527361, partial [Nephila pilipes]